ncbi:DUF2189 domain-containing protein [Azoarcus sp. DD4]|uniref:DUF2189 domain-containing protein n=1 Tax=Azoarcus sp. DD4 TaxID=2027405 RepID=UPI00143CC149|nr:DUF2189 domain-containing protein [Azoarcus sp. DD4]
MTRTTFEFSRDSEIPEVNKIETSAPIRWLSLGWNDLAHNPGPSLAYGFLVTAMGWVILLFTSSRPALFAAGVSGFLLVAPLIQAGLHELSRRRAAREPVSFESSLEGWNKNRQQLFSFGLVLALFAFAWAGISDVLFDEFFAGGMPETTGTLYQTIFAWDYPGFRMVYVLVGAVLALSVFMISAASVPMILDRSAGCLAAMTTSARAVSVNLTPMLIWALLIATLVAVGFASLSLGLIFIFPWLGHAAWHAYKDLIS